MTEKVALGITVVRSSRYGSTEHLIFGRAGVGSEATTLCGRTVTIGWSSDNLPAWRQVVCGSCARSLEAHDAVLREYDFRKCHVCAQADRKLDELM